MEQILLAYDLPKETVTAIMMLYKSKVHSPDGGTNFFNIDTGVFHGDKLAQFLFIFCLDYIH